MLLDYDCGRAYSDNVNEIFGNHHSGHLGDYLFVVSLHKRIDQKIDVSREELEEHVLHDLRISHSTLISNVS